MAVHLFALHAQHDGDGGTVDVGIHQCHLGSGLGKRDGEVHRHGALAHAALARGNGDDVVDVFEHLFEFLLGVGLGLAGEVDFHLRLAVHQLVDGGDAVVAHLLLHRAGGSGEHQVEAHLLPLHLDVLYHAQLR